MKVSVTSNENAANNCEFSKLEAAGTCNSGLLRAAEYKSLLVLI